MVPIKAAAPRRASALVSMAPFLLVLTGCDVIPPEYEKYWVALEKEARVFISVLSGNREPEARSSPVPSVSPSPSPEEFNSVSARQAKANAELLHEVFKVVYIREPRDRSEFGSLVDTLNQGGSLEGLYNGFTHSSDYRRLEMANAGASTGALNAFGEELAILESELPMPVEFDASATQPLALAVEVGAEPVAAPPMPSQKEHADGVHLIEYGKVPLPGDHGNPPVAAPHTVGSESSRLDLKPLADKYTKQFVGASIFTLKRILGDEALKVIAVKKDYPEKLALWYSKWVGHMAARGVDFGIAQRNKSDEAFHYKWALTAGEDRINWEVLNRLHRVLNEANRQKQ